MPSLYRTRIFKPGQVPERIQAQVRMLMQEVDQEFIPALSQRSRIGQGRYSNQLDNGLDIYAESLFHESFIVTLHHGDRLVGMCCFLKNYHYKEEKYLYLGPTALAKEYRGKGLAKKFLPYLLSYSIYYRCPLLTRIPSSMDAAHLMLPKFAEPIGTIGDGSENNPTLVIWIFDPSKNLYSSVTRSALFRKDSSYKQRQD